jgi:transcriptional regulator with XRE-family HTH domain
MTNKEKFLELVSKEKTTTLREIKQRIKNRAILRESQQIAIKVLMKLDELGWSQKKLAEKMKVRPQQVSKIVRGKENLTLETQVRLQEILDIPVLASFFDNKDNKRVRVDMVLRFKEKLLVFEHKARFLSEDYTNSFNKQSIITMNYNKAVNEYTYEVAC